MVAVRPWSCTHLFEEQIVAAGIGRGAEFARLTRNLEATRRHFPAAGAIPVTPGQYLETMTSVRR